MDKLTKHLLNLASNRNATIEQLMDGIKLMDASMEAERVEIERQKAAGTYKPYTPPTAAELRRRANANLAKRYKRP